MVLAWSLLWLIEDLIIVAQALNQLSECEEQSTKNCGKKCKMKIVHLWQGWRALRVKFNSITSCYKK